MSCVCHLIKMRFFLSCSTTSIDRDYLIVFPKFQYPHIYLVEKVVKHDKVGKRLIVKWIGFDSIHNKWIPEENVLPSEE
jgi:hypothetical protein